jgi:hypothetical protein
LKIWKAHYTNLLLYIHYYQSIFEETELKVKGKKKKKKKLLASGSYYPGWTVTSRSPNV